MQYIVLDLEWNQAMSSNSSIFNKLPIRLRGEIIQIGAVKLNSDLMPSQEFQADIRPVYFRRMHYKVKKLTGFDKERLNGGASFKRAMQDFLEWCGGDCVFMTWGYDDEAIMEQNLIIHDMDIDWMGRWINLQVIYNSQVEGDKNQRGLSSAMERFGIEQTRVAHDALGDAYNAALVSSRLDLEAGLAEYSETRRKLSTRPDDAAGAHPPHLAPIEHIAFPAYISREQAWSDPELTGCTCPDCGNMLTAAKWINQGDKRYTALAECPRHGACLLRLRFRHSEDDTWTVNKLVYRADEDMKEHFYSKSANPGKRRRKRKKNAH